MGRKMYRRGTDGEIRVEVGHEFPTIVEFRTKIREYILRNGFQFLRKENEKRRFIGECKHRGCPC